MSILCVYNIMYRPIDRDFERGVRMHQFIKITLILIFISIHCYGCGVAAQESYQVVRGNFFRVARAVRCSNSYIAHKLALHSPHVYMISHLKAGFIQTSSNPTPCLWAGNWITIAGLKQPLTSCCEIPAMVLSQK